MTDPTPATVAVPVELIRQMLDNEDTDLTDDVHNAFRALLPKPTPRLVAVDLDKLFTERSFGVPVVTLDLLSDQPDLLTLLQGVMVRVQLNSNQRSAVLIALKHDLGVTE
jgi:hypothetical protein